jgi:tetratricopeptide (TPR) repeat protein
MSQLQDRIDQFRKMANDDPDNELAHFRLGQLLMEADRLDEAIQSFRRTLELFPAFSKVYQLLGDCLIKLGKNDDAAQILNQGFTIADERGDNIPRDEMAKMLTQLGKPIPQPKKVEPASEGGFRCQRPGCMAGRHARRLSAPPMNDEVGKRIQDTVCADCWDIWLRNYSIKVINELRLDLSTDRGLDEYDRYMREFLGFE